MRVELLGRSQAPRVHTRPRRRGITQQEDV